VTRISLVPSVPVHVPNVFARHRLDLLLDDPLIVIATCGLVGSLVNRGDSADLMSLRK